MNERKIGTQEMIQGAVALGAGIEALFLSHRDPNLDLLVATTVYTICGVPITPIVNVINEKLDGFCEKLLE